jgi:hypothetical protein
MMARISFDHCVIHVGNWDRASPQSQREAMAAVVPVILIESPILVTGARLAGWQKGSTGLKK